MYAIKDSSRLALEAMGITQYKQHCGRRVIVSSDCQTAGIAVALGAICPKDTVTPLVLPRFVSVEDESQFAEKLKDADIWVSVGKYNLPEKYGLSNRLRLIKIPAIAFTAFHPDLVYARKASTNELTTAHYNSAIVVWAYNNRLEVSDAEKLFNKESYSKLGYLDRWGPSTDALKRRFQGTDVDFEEFFLSMRREGVFMYTVNHPKIIALIKLAKLVAKKMGVSQKVLDRYVDVKDGLNGYIWPIYPEIGESLSLHSSYEWTMRGGEQNISGVCSFVSHSFDNYARQAIMPNDLASVGIDTQLYNQVLGAQVGTRA